VPWAADNGIAIDHRADVPLGVQIEWGIRTAVAAGRLRPAERLPALRDLATELGVNHNTLRGAVAKLERDGVLESRHGSGTFVAEGAPRDGRHAPVVEEVVRLAADAGLSPRALATALYLAEEPARRDPEAAERRALRDEIAVLDRLVVELEEKLTTQYIPPEPRRARGGRLLGVEDLREERDAVLRRLAAAQRLLEGPEDEDPAPAPAKRPARSPRAAPRPGIAPA
jgi:DNA-binding transcriptional regulator YhcF (GntR family)